MGLQRSLVEDTRAGSSHIRWIHSRLRTVIANDKSACVCLFVHLQVDVKPVSGKVKPNCLKSLDFGKFDSQLT
jgi:hypothetical protein